MDHTPGERQFTDTTQLWTYLKGKYAMADEDIEAHIDFQKGVKARYGAAHLQGGRGAGAGARRHRRQP